MERINVAVRARPLSPEDAKTSPWRIDGNSIFFPNHSSQFEFDRIFGQDCKTLEVYQARTRDIVAAAVRGFNGTVFAYGQTNSGKTHTMRGSLTEPGVIPLAVHDLFDIIQGEVEREFLLRMSYMEIYNEDINDLLVPEHRKLQIHESLERGIYVAGLREEIVASPRQVLNLMDFGETHRHFGETNMNLYSSRSHTIFRMIIESRDKIEDDNNCNACDAVRVSVLNLVDLAGSERAAKTGAEGVRLKEGSHINKSLMTLGTVIKKLSEGAESQGGHVPYRDSKLTRILQPALGGNANTAIICNITLAQIHADETKSSLQFASRALFVTNCARVNEILTDAALLKRQKKEIEELRAKLQASHSEHLEEEILSLRNTLLQSELERERISLELEEEKKAQAEREKVLQEQAKKIKNLSSMVLYSNRDENCERMKKNKRRDTWCPGKLARENLQEMYSNVCSKASAVKSARPEREMGPLLPFEELVNETVVEDESCKKDKDGRNNSLGGCNLPDPCALLNITRRRKLPLKKQNSFVEDNELVELQAAYDDLLLKFESQRTTSEIQIDFLTRKIAEVDFSSFHVNENTLYGDKNASIRESEANTVIKQLQEKIKMLEVQKSSNRQNLDTLVELVMERDICARENFEELHEELLNAREEVRVAQERLAFGDSVGRVNLSEVQEIINELQSTKEVVHGAFSLVDEVFKMQSSICNDFLDFKASVGDISVQQHSIVCNHQKLHCCMIEKIFEAENEKLLIDNQYIDLQRQIQELRELSEQQNLGKMECFTQIQTLENELSYLSSSSLAREKERLKKDLEKTKTKLKETERRLKTAIQEKTKLEGEKAFAEREVKRLLGQNTLLERDISKLDSLAGRRRDWAVHKTSKVFDPKMEDYKMLEVLAFEMETTIASLEEELAYAKGEREEVLSRNECLASELEAERSNKSSTELNVVQEEVSGLRLMLEESKLNEQKMESFIKNLLEEKEELAMQLTDSLLEMEEEKAIWSSKEKASIEAIEDRAKLYNAKTALLSKGISEVRNELESCKEECKFLRERLASCEEEAKLDKKCSIDKCLEIDQLKNEFKVAEVESNRSQEVLKSNLEVLSLELQHAHEKAETLQKELIFLSKERKDLLLQIRELDNGSSKSNDFKDVTNQHLLVTKERDNLITQIEGEHIRKNCNVELSEAKVQVEELTRTLSKMEVKIRNDEVNNNKEKAKLRMRLRGTQAQLDAFRYRYKQAVDESHIMNNNFEKASKELKQKLASTGAELLNHKKQLAAARDK